MEAATSKESNQQRARSAPPKSRSEPPECLLKLADVCGVPVTSWITSPRIKALCSSQFAHRPGDLWLAGYPKSGNTWLAEIVKLLYGFPPQRYNAGAADEIFSYKSSAPCPLNPAPLSCRSTMECAIHPEASVGPNASSWEQLQGKATRVFQTHWPHQDHVLKVVPFSLHVIMVTNTSVT
jgi:hypothetical protein